MDICLIIPVACPCASSFHIILHKFGTIEKETNYWGSHAYIYKSEYS